MLLLADSTAFVRCFERGMTRIAIAGMPEAIEAMSDYEQDVILRGSDAIIPVSGPLSYRYDIYSYISDGSSYTGLGAKIDAAEQSGDVKRIILLVDSPGGEVTGIVELAEKIAASKKEVVAVIDPFAASAGYWIASQADRIVAMPSAQVGSVGAQFIIKSIAKMLEMEGMDVALIRSAVSPLKNIGHSAEPLTDEVKAHYQAKADKYGDIFVSMVAAGRGVSVDKVKADFGQGGMLFADEALAAGMIDEIGTISSVLAESRVAAAQPRRASNMRSEMDRIW